MVVLSLFDGIGTGLYCLKQAGIDVSKYYASEIDENAIAIARFNHLSKVTELGDINDWRDWGLDLRTIDLLIGGSPCTSFTNAGKREGFEGVSGLFWRYVEILNEIKNVNPNVKFLLENVKMKTEWRNIITEALGVEPILIDSSVCSAQHRERLYWCNWEVPGVENNNVVIKDIIEKDVDKKYHLTKKHYDGICRSYKFKYCKEEGKSSTLMSCYFKQPPAGPYIKCKDSESGYRRFTPVECERLMTLPDRYTEDGIWIEEKDKGIKVIVAVKTVSDTARYRALGNGWCADVITHIFKNLPL